MHIWINPEAHAHFDLAMKRAIHNEETVEYEATGTVSGHYYRGGIRPVVVEGQVQSLVLITHDITDLKLAEQKLHVLLEANSKINCSLDHDTICRTLVTAACTLVGASAGSVGLIKAGRMVYKERYDGNRWSPFVHDFTPDNGITGHVMQTLKSYYTNDTDRDPYVIAKEQRQYPFRQLIAIPILDTSKQLLGCFDLYDAIDGRAYDERDIELLEGLAANAAVALSHARVLREQKQLTRVLQQSEQRMRHLTMVSNQHIGLDYFKQLVKACAMALEVKIVFIAELLGARLQEASSLAMWNTDALSESFSWVLAGTPSEYIREGQSVYIARNVQQQYPMNDWLAEVDAQSYLAIPFHNGQGQITGHIGLVHDKPLDDAKVLQVTLGVFAERAGMELERMRDLAAIQESEEKFRTLTDNAQDAVIVLGNQGNISLWNRAAERLFGYSAKEVLGKDITSLIIPERYRDRHHQGHRLFRDTGQGQFVGETVEVSALHRNGEAFPVELSISAAKTNGQWYALGMVRDLRERKHNELALHRSLEGTIDVVVKALEARDPYTAGHERRVAELSFAIGEALGFSESVLEGLRLGALIHDVGKINLPAELLSKPTKLAVLEYQLIQEHARVGYEILREVDFPWPIADIAHQHHERMDGSGYPQGLCGEAICQEARIVAVADVVEAMVSHRPYRPGLGIDKTLGEIRRGRGQQYDADVADACLQLFAENRFAWSSVV